MNSPLNHSLVSEKYFFKRRELLETPHWIDVGDCRLACLYFRRKHNRKTIVHFHGNGEVVADYETDYANKLIGLGFNVLFAEYRGYGMSEGEPALVSMLSDAVKIVESLNEPLENIILFGRSVGSIYAIHAASKFPGIGGLVIESGIASIKERIDMRIKPEQIGLSPAQLDTEVNKHFNTEAKLKKFAGATMVMHTQNDHIIGFGHGRQLYQWANQPKTYKWFSRGNHNTIIAVNFENYFKTLTAFVKKYL